MMIELPKEIEVIREELCDKYANGMAFPKIDYRNGFNACYDVLETRGLVRLEEELPPTTTARNPSDSECATTRLENFENEEEA